MIGSEKNRKRWGSLDKSLAEGQDNMHLLRAKGDIMEADGKYDEAIKAYDLAIQAASIAPDMLVEVVAAKPTYCLRWMTSNLHCRRWINFADDTNMPTDLRIATLLHKSLMMRDSDR